MFGEWIPVTEQIQKEFIGLLTVESERNGKRFVLNIGYGFLNDYLRPVAWMELPEPYNGSKNEWIPVSQRMPEEHKFNGDKRIDRTSKIVLVTVEDEANGERWVDDNYLIDGQWRGRLADGLHIIAWMPFPESYLEGN